MAFVVEDGTGKVDANSFASVADYNAYHEGYVADLPTADDAKKQKALMMATRVIDTNMEWFGYRGSDEQRLNWPRYGIERRDSSQAGMMFAPALSRGTGLGVYWASDEIPQLLKDATCELARELIKADRTVESDTKGISQFSIGQGAVSATFDKLDRPEAMTEQVLYMLQVFGQSRASRSFVRVERG